ncbi:MAG TPA: response regulator [Candidatus Limnocylindria bacterium]|jgi:CheY-like chemotaxis protein/phosphoribosyl 1,2-cyclic phosphodiesterase|nr:response regulator [Candidatus Limnocylindria bacterium]
MRIRFWGTRGSIAAAGPETIRYGGNTPCVEMLTNDGAVLVFDCGTGARKLGLTLGDRGPLRLHLLLSHTHADHIQGLPFFLPAFTPGSHITIYGPAGVDRSLPTAVGGSMDYAYFPVPLESLPAKVDFVELGETEFSLGTVGIKTQFLNHTSPCLGYRVVSGTATFVYATDHEAHANPQWRADRTAEAFDPALLAHPGDTRHAAFLAGADIVVHDAQYGIADYPSRAGWGHSTVEYAVDVALAARAKTLVLFHHDPGRDDAGIDDLAAVAERRVAASGLALRVVAAAEGEELLLAEGAHPRSVDVVAPQPATMPDRARILVADDDVALVRILETVLRGDGYDVESAFDGMELVKKATATSYDLVLLDIQMPHMDGLSASRQLRALDGYRDTPLVVLTARTRQDDMAMAFAAGISDYIRKPFALPQVRARVRSWLARGAARRV